MTLSEADIIEIITSRTKIDATEFSRDMTLESVGLDSLDLIETVFELEDRFNISIPFNANNRDSLQLQTAGDLIDMVVDLAAQTGITVTRQA